ncbi:MAG: hypothetical protein K5785_00755 [Nitrosarchaeum sp.]|nr:hypothetical protein [Nitrosarchaeum sp.]
MRTESKICYQCGATVPVINSSLIRKQCDKFERVFVINTVIVSCPQGHKNTVQVMEDDS